MRPEAIFRQTKLFSIAEEAGSSGNGVLVPRYILGDSCLPLLTWLVTPYNEEDESCRGFNNVIHTALDTVEIAFPKIRARWRILDKKWKPETIKFLPFVITTGCLLHNFLVNSGDDDSQEECVNGDGDNGETRKDEEEDDEETRRYEGEAYRRIRDAIAENLRLVSSLR